MSWVKIGPVFTSHCECGATIKSKAYYLKQHSGKCRRCAHRKRPFEHLYNKLKNTAKHEKHELLFTFQQFLEFTKQTKCHYCAADIEWREFCYENSKYKSGAYFLDRKDNALGYSVENCVVCCSRCNRAKGSNFTYEEWFNMTAWFRVDT